MSVQRANKTNRQRHDLPPDPLRRALIRAADQTTDRVVSDWLRGIADRGEVAGSVDPK